MSDRRPAFQQLHTHCTVHKEQPQTASTVQQRKVVLTEQTVDSVSGCVQCQRQLGCSPSTRELGMLMFSFWELLRCVERCGACGQVNAGSVSHAAAGNLDNLQPWPP